MKPRNCVSVNKSLCGKLVSSLESLKIFDEGFKVTAVPFSIPDFNLLSYKLDNFIFISAILIHFILILY